MRTVINIFLEEKEKKLIQIINILFEHQQSEITLNEISKKVNVSTQIVKRLLESYQTLDLSVCGITLEKVNNKMAYYRVNQYSENQLQQILVKKSSLFKLCEKLFEKTFKDLDNFANDNFMSIPTLYRRLSKLKTLLTTYQIALDFRNKDYFTGEEYRIRHFMFELLYLGYGLTEDYNRDQQIEEQVLSQDLAFPVVQRIKLLAYIAKQRTKEGSYIEKNIQFTAVHDLKGMAPKIKKLCVESLPAEISPAKKKRELDFFLMYIVTFDVIAIDQFDNLTNLLLLLDNPYLVKIKEWIFHFINEFRIRVSANGYFFLVANLYYHSIKKDLLTAKQIVYSDKGKDVVAENDSLVFVSNKIEKFLAKMQPMFPDSLSEKEFYYMLIRGAFVHSTKEVNVCIFSGTAQAHKRLIEDNIRKYSLVPIKFNEIITKQVDLIISDSYFNREQSKIMRNEEVIFISKYPTVVEYGIVIQKILKIFEKKYSLAN